MPESANHYRKVGAGFAKHAKRPRPYKENNIYNFVMVKFDPKVHHRQSIRLPKYNYSQAGGYFITIVAWQREFLFGDIKNGEMKLNQRGQIADECWRDIPNHFPNVELGAYIIMPNHVHGIVFIREIGATHAPTRRGTIYRAPTEESNIERFGKPIKESFPTIIRTYKAAVTRIIGRELNETGIWQRNYYEHIIRDEKDLQNKTEYIEANPLLWEQDEENPVNIHSQL